MRRVILCVALFRIMLKNRVRKSAARRNRVPAKPNRFCGVEERQPIKAKPYFYKNKIRRRRTRKKVVATVKRCERVYKRTDEPSELFCERGGTVQRVIDFLNRVEANS